MHITETRITVCWHCLTELENLWAASSYLLQAKERPTGRRRKGHLQQPQIAQRSLGESLSWLCLCLPAQADLGLEALPWLGRAGWSPRVSISTAEAVRGNQGPIHQSSCREGCSPKAAVLYMLQICYLKFCVHTFVLLDVLAQPDRKDLCFMECNFNSVSKQRQ